MGAAVACLVVVVADAAVGAAAVGVVIVAGVVIN